ncbi:MAG: hypothetical protein WA977_00105 [Halobacteriota archaeon]
MSNKEIPEGFKQAAIGIIPEDWKVVSLGDERVLNKVGVEYE